MVQINNYGRSYNYSVNTGRSGSTGSTGSTGGAGSMGSMGSAGSLDGSTYTPDDWNDSGSVNEINIVVAKDTKTGKTVSFAYGDDHDSGVTKDSSGNIIGTARDGKTSGNWGI